MKKRILFLFLLFLGVLLSFNVGAACIGQNYLFNCGDIVNESCTLNESVIYNGDCFIVRTENVTIDCNEYNMTSNGSGAFTAITFDNLGGSADNGIIKNCNFYNWGAAIVVNHTDNVTITNNGVYNNIENPIFISYSINSNIFNNTFYDAFSDVVAIYAENINYTNISYNYFNNISQGILLNATCSYNYITNNQINNTQDYAIYLFLGSDHNLISYNNFYNDCENIMTTGIIYAFSSNHNNITHNNISEGSYMGIHLRNSFGNLIKGNRIHMDQFKGYYGIHLENVSDTLIIDNIVYNNSYGVYAEYSSSLNITDNVLNGSDWYGIYLKNNIDLGFINNTIRDTACGIYGEINNTDVFVYKNILEENNERFNTSDGGYGLVAQFGTYNWTISDNIVMNNNLAGLVFYGGGSDNIIEYNSVISNYASSGIVDFGVNNSIIRYNKIYGHYGNSNVSEYGFGIIIGSLLEDNYPNLNSLVHDNEIYENDVGIGAMGNNSIIKDNDIHDNIYGIYSSYYKVVAGSEFHVYGQNSTIKNNDLEDNDYGIHIKAVDSKYVDNMTITSNNINGKSPNIGIGVFVEGRSEIFPHGGHYHIIDGNTISNFGAGIQLNDTNHNNITNNILRGNDVDFLSYCSKFSDDNKIENTIFENTELNFTFFKEFALSSRADLPKLPSGYTSIGKFVKIDNLTSGTSLDIYFFYSDSELGDIKDESTLGLWKYKNGWKEVDYMLNKEQNYIYAYLDEFSLFAILGKSKKTSFGGGGTSFKTKCGDGVCEGKETYLTCPEDCPAPLEPPKDNITDLGNVTEGKEFNGTEGDAFSFYIKNEKHVLQIDGIKENETGLWIWSEPFYIILLKEETKNLDVDGNGYYDTEIILRDIKDKEGFFFIKEINEEIPAEEETQKQLVEQKRSYWWLWIVLIIAILIIIAIIYYLYREKKLRYLGYK